MSNYIKRYLPNLRSNASTNKEDFGEIISDEIKSWGKTNPYYVNYFDQPKVKTLLDICKIVSENNTISTRLIIDFISGLALYPIYLRTQNVKQGEEVERLINPVFNLLGQKITSKDYLETLFNTLEIDPGLAKSNRINPPLTEEDLFVHTKRINRPPLSKSDLSTIKNDWEKWLIHNRYNGKDETDNRVVVSIPRFKSESADIIFGIIKDHFPGQEDLLRQVIDTGELKEQKLLFHGNCRTLLDFFKQLMKGHFLIIQVQSDFEKWIEEGFEYVYQDKPHKIKSKYASKIISGNERAAEGNRLIDVIKEKDKFKIVQLEIANRKQRYNK